MARSANEVRITPSVLDRLLDYEPSQTTEAPLSRSASLRDLKLSVRRDLEWLLNARRIPHEIDGGLQEIKKSLVMYGLPDTTGVSGASNVEQARLTKELENAIRYFEPRFLDVRVTLEPINNFERMLKFKIEARLDIEPAPEPSAFDTVLQMGSGGFEVKEK